LGCTVRERSKRLPKKWEDKGCTKREKIAVECDEYGRMGVLPLKPEGREGGEKFEPNRKNPRGRKSARKWAMISVVFTWLPGNQARGGKTGRSTIPEGCLKDRIQKKPGAGS